MTILPGESITKLLKKTGWSRERLAQAMNQPNLVLLPPPTSESIHEMESRERLSQPASRCVHTIAAQERLRWKRGRWVDLRPERLTGADVLAIRRALGWSQPRLAREIDVAQPQIARWEANPDRLLTGPASYALRAVQTRRLGRTA